MNRPVAEQRGLLQLMFSGHHGWLRARLLKRLGCPHDADDVAAETFTQLAALPDLAAIREPRALLTTVAKRLLYDAWRRRDLEQAYLNALAAMPEALEPSPEDRALVLESLIAVDRALSDLSPKARLAFLYSQLDGLTYREIAEHLDVSVSRVRQYMAQGLRACSRVAGDA